MTGQKAASGLDFEELCEYPDGTRVLCAAMLEVEDGRISRQTSVEAWNEQPGPVRKV